MRDADHRARSFMTDQHGLITTAQAHGLGLTANDVAHRVERGEWTWRTPRVLAGVAAAPSPHQALLTLVLDAGAGSALSHTDALTHWGVGGLPSGRPHVVRHRDRLDHKVRGATLHEVRFLPWEQVRMLEGIPVVQPSLALLQIAGLPSIHTARLARAIDTAWNLRLVTYDTLKAVDRQMSRQGRRGLVRFRELVEERGPAYVPPASGLESRFAKILRDAGRPEMRRQIDCGSDARWIGRVDFRAVDCPLIAEVQSERFHHGLTAERDDMDRLAGLHQAGFVVVEIVEEHLFHSPAKVLAVVDAGRQRALHRRAA
jgi:very-short-patch-repair endonuclease